MKGAVLGDIIGSRFEFNCNDKTKKFELLIDRCTFTDDTVMSIAVAQSLLSDCQDEATLERILVKNMQKWGRRYPDGGYGGMFRHWLVSDNPRPYHSYGNGSAMRVSSVGWLYDSLQETEHIAEITARVTHDHPDGIKGAQATAVAIWLARTGHCKEEIRSLMTERYGYDFSRTLNEIRPSHGMDETCPATVIEALTAFFEADDYEDAVRNAVSLGGDTDTLAAITGGVAEAYFGIPEHLEKECMERIPVEMQEVIHQFDSVKRRHV